MALSPSLRRTVSFAWISIITVLIAVLAYHERNNIIHAIPYLVQTNYAVLIVTGGCELVYFVLQAIAAKKLYRQYGVNAQLSAITGMLFHATMLNEVIPTSGASGTAGFIFWGDRLGYGLRSSVAVSIWLSIVSYFTLIPAIIVCVRVLSILKAGPQYVIWGSIKVAIGFVALCTFLALLWLFYVKFRQRETSGKTLHDGYIKQLVDKIQNRLHWYTKNELRKEWKVITERPWHMITLWILLFSIYPVRVIMLMLCFTALHHPIGLSIAIEAYSLTLLFSVVSFAPTTLGVVEVALTTTLGWFGVPLPLALAGTLLYRIPSFWLPIPVGLMYQTWLVRQIH